MQGSILQELTQQSAFDAREAGIQLELRQLNPFVRSALWVGMHRTLLCPTACRAPRGQLALTAHQLQASDSIAWCVTDIRQATMATMGALAAAPALNANPVQ